MEIVVRTDTAETVVRPESGAGAASGTGPAEAAGMNAGPAPSGPSESGAPPAQVAATEPPRATSGADLSAGAAPDLH